MNAGIFSLAARQVIKKTTRRPLRPPCLSKKFITDFIGYSLYIGVPMMTRPKPDGLVHLGGLHVTILKPFSSKQSDRHLTIVEVAPFSRLESQTISSLGRE